MPADNWLDMQLHPAPSNASLLATAVFWQRQSSGNGSLLATAVFWQRQSSDEPPPKSKNRILGEGKNRDFP
jgi:hypothetical protein